MKRKRLLQSPNNVFTQRTLTKRKARESFYPIKIPLRPLQFFAALCVKYISKTLQQSLNFFLARRVTPVSLLILLPEDDLFHDLLVFSFYLDKVCPIFHIGNI